MSLQLELLDRSWNRLGLTPNVETSDVDEELGSSEGRGTAVISNTDHLASLITNPDDTAPSEQRFRVYEDGVLSFAGLVDTVVRGDETITIGGIQRGAELAHYNFGQRDMLGIDFQSSVGELLRNNVARSPFATVTASNENEINSALNAITGQPVKGSFWGVDYDGTRPSTFAASETITVDLGKNYVIDVIRVIPEWWDGKYYKWRVHVGADGTDPENFTEVGSKDDAFPTTIWGREHLHDTGSQTARYIQVEVYASSDGYPRIAGIMAYQNIASVGSDTTYAVPWVENDDSGNVTLSGSAVRVVQDGAFNGSGQNGDSYVTSLPSGSSSITHRFRGTSAAVYFTQGEASVAEVFLDDVSQGEVVIPADEYQFLGFSTTGLTLDEHTLRVEGVSGNPQVDYFTGEYQTSFRTLEEDDQFIAYQGKWSRVFQEHRAGKSTMYSTQSGSSFAHNFRGDSIQWITTKSPQYGIVEWFIDDVSQGTIDLYNASFSNQQTLIDWSGSYGVHTLRVTNTGGKNASSSGIGWENDRLQGNFGHRIFLRSAYDTNLALLGRLSEMTNSFLRLNYDGTVDLLSAVGTDTGEVIREGENEGGTIIEATVEGDYSDTASAILALGKGSETNALRVFVQDKEAVSRMGIKVAKIESRDVVDAYLLVRQAWQTLQDSKKPKRNYRATYDGNETLTKTIRAEDFATAVLALSPVAYWRLGESSGSTATDESANAEDGIYEGSPTLGAPGMLHRDYDSAVEFPGTDTDYMQSPTLSALGTAYSIAAWITPSNDDSGIFISGGGSRPYLRHLNSDITFAFTNSGGAQKTMTTTGDAAPIGTPVFVVATHDGTTARIYINGVEAVADATASQAPGALSFRVGRWGAGGLPYSGTVDEPAIFNSALSPADVMNLYRIGSNPVTREARVPVVSPVSVGDLVRLWSPRRGLSTGDTYRVIRRRRQWGDDGKTVEIEVANRRDRLSNLLTRATRDLSLTTDTPQGHKNVTQYGGSAENFVAEVSGSTFRSAEMDFFIDEDSVILDVKLRMKIGRYRSYERDTTSGGGSTSGGGGSSTPTSSTEAAHRHMMMEWETAASGEVIDGIYNVVNSSGVPFRVGVWTDNDGVDVYTFQANGSHSHTVTIGSHTHTTPNHTHTQTYDIFEEGTLPGAVSVLVDDVNVDSVIQGPFTATSSNDTFDVSLTGVITTPGWHTLRFEAASGKGRITPYVLVKSLQLQ